MYVLIKLFLDPRGEKKIFLYFHKVNVGELSNKEEEVKN